MRGGDVIFATHKVPDIDGITGVVLKIEGEEIDEKARFIFLSEGDRLEQGNLISNVVMIDRGHGPYDHHGKHNTKTSAEIVAKELGIETNEHIFHLLRLVENNDARGHSDPFDIGDLTKKISHSRRISDEEAMRVGIRIVQDALDFKQMEIAEEIQRDHNFTRSVVKEFIGTRKFIGQRVRKYYELLGNPEFQRPFDLAEILTIEKKLHGAREARKFGLKILSLVTEQERNFEKALEELKNPDITKIYPVPRSKSTIVITVESSNPEINRAARFQWKTVALVIQKNPEIGGVQIFPNKKWLKSIETIMDNVTACVRLEELLSQKRKVITNFRILSKPERIHEVPEWYYTWKRGFFLFNKSLTADDPEMIPETKIPIEKIAGIAKIVLQFGDKFDFRIYAARRIAKNL